MLDLKQLFDAMPPDLQRKVSCHDLKRTVDKFNGCHEPRTANTYTKSYVSGEFGDTSNPLDYLTLKAGEVELANLPLREIVHIADDLREEIERYRMEHKPDTRHRFAPNKKYPWFCAHCGYPPEHPVMHLPAAASLDSENAEASRSAGDQSPTKPTNE